MIKVPAAGPIPARIMIVGEAPGADEESNNPPTPFVGRSGQLLNSMLTEVGLSRAACFTTNVIKYRPPGNKLEGPGHAWWTDKKTKAAKHNCPHFRDGMWYNSLVAEGLVELPQEIERAQPECIIALGNAALWALTGNLGISNWRGSELWWNGGRRIPVIPTFHPAYVLRVWEWKAAVTHDLRVRVVGKLGKPGLREEPPYRFIVPSSHHDALNELHDLQSHIEQTPGFVDLTCDVETRQGRIACVGFGWSELDALCIPLMHVDGRRIWPADEAQIAAYIRQIMEHPRVRLINQNFNYDRQYFVRDPLFGFRPRLHYDTMIGHHLLFPGTEKSLACQSAMYRKHHRFWKEEGKEIDTEADEARWWHYNCLDCVATWEIAAVTRPLLVKAGFAQETLV